MKLSELLGCEIVDADGERLGSVHDVRVERRNTRARKVGTERWVVVGLVLGGRGIRERVGYTNGREGRAVHSDRELVPWERVSSIEDGRIGLIEEE
jgi:sporulation protein YlmC with PRC-barrel domain